MLPGAISTFTPWTKRPYSSFVLVAAGPAVDGRRDEAERRVQAELGEVRAVGRPKLLPMTIVGRPDAGALLWSSMRSDGVDVPVAGS